MFDSYMQHRNVVKIGRLKSGPPTGDWVTIGVVVSTSAKMSSKGASYTIWKVSDLTREGSILLFLFGGAHHEFWKAFPGEIVALLNPQLSENKERRDDGTPAFSISNEAQIKKMGKSRDFGICASLRLDGQVREKETRKKALYCGQERPRETCLHVQQDCDKSPPYPRNEPYMHISKET